MSADEENVWNTYAMDASDALAEIEASLLALEMDASDGAQVHQLYRALHTLKGNSAVMGLTVVEKLAHAAEDAVGLVRDTGAAFDRPLIELMLCFVDRLGALAQRVSVERRDVEEEEVAELVARAHAWTREHGGILKEVSVVGRGEIVIWSDRPPRASVANTAEELLPRLGETAKSAAGQEHAPASGASGVIGGESAAPPPRAPERPAAKGQRRAHEPDAKADVLRVDAGKVSLIMDLTGEIALACGAVTHHPEIDPEKLAGFAAAAHKLEMLIRELQNEVSAMRLVPVAGVFQRMRRVVRDTAQRTGKKVELTLRGEETEIDKVMVDSLHDPLVHLLRNAIDHGIEAPAERLRAGKPEVGQIVLEASHRGGEVSVEIRDDGRGLDRQKVLARARQRGLVENDAPLSDEQIVNLVFLPGFSTKDKIDELSGRGVGMDVVKTTIEGVRGRVQLQSRQGEGSQVNLTVPLTLAFVEAMIVRDGERLFALPVEKVFEVFKATSEQLCRNSADGEAMVRVRDSLIPVLWLHRFYGEPARSDEQLDGRVIVVVQTSRGPLAVPVDALLGNQPVMLKPLRGLLSRVRAAAGCGMLRSGDVALAVDCEQLSA